MGIGESLIVAVLLKRKDQKLFSIAPIINVRVSGFDFEAALTGRDTDNTVIIDPNLASWVSELPFRLTDIDQHNLQDVWHNRILGGDVQFITLPVFSGSDMPNDDGGSAADKERTTEATAVDPLEDKIRPKQRHVLDLSQEPLGEATGGAMYVEIWNIVPRCKEDHDPELLTSEIRRERGNAGEPSAMGPPKLKWKNLGDPLKKDTLDEYFSWVKDELDLLDISNVEVEQQKLEHMVTEDVSPEATHTLCSLLSVSHPLKRSLTRP